MTSEHSNHNQILCRALRREVTLEATERKQRAGTTSLSEEYWPDMEGLDHRDTVTDFALPEGTFFDIGLVHLLTTTTLDRLREFYPQGRFEIRRIRSNVVVETPNGAQDFVEPMLSFAEKHHARLNRFSVT